MARTHEEKRKAVLNSGEERLCINIHDKGWHRTSYMEVIVSLYVCVASHIQRLLLAIFTTESPR